MTRHLNSAADHILKLAETPGFEGSAEQQKLAAAVRAMKVSSYAHTPIRAEGLWRRAVAYLRVAARR